MARRSVLLLGNYRPALAAARALAGLGHRVIVSREGDDGRCGLSRHVTEIWENPPLEKGRSVFLNGLERFLAEREDIGFVLPIAEDFLHALAFTQWQPPSGVHLVSPDYEAVLGFADKPNVLALADRLEVPTLPHGIVGTHDDLLGKAKIIGFPITVRPLGTTARLAGRKAIIASDGEELSKALPDWPVGHTHLLLQKYAVGTRHNLYFAAQAGRLTGYVESRIAQTNRSDGTGLAVLGHTVTPNPKLVADTQALTGHYKYTGIGLAQFIVDHTNGDRCFLELNPRVSGSHAVPEGAGLPLTQMALDLAAGNAAKTPVDPVIGKAGLQYVWTLGALGGMRAELKEGRITPFSIPGAVLSALYDAVRADIHMVFSKEDPGYLFRLATDALLKRLSVRPGLDGRSGKGVALETSEKAR